MGGFRFDFFLDGDGFNPGGLIGDDTGTDDGDTDTGSDDDKVPAQPTYSQANPADFEWVKQQVVGMTGASPALVHDWLNSWGLEYLDIEGTGKDTTYNYNVTPDQLWASNGFVSGAAWLPVLQDNILPPAFNLVNEDGSMTIMRRDFLTGLTADTRAGTGSRFAGGGDVVRSKPTEDEPDGLVLFNSSLPMINLADILPQKKPKTGTGRANRAFDTDQLTAGATDQYRYFLLEPDDAQIAQWVEDYKKEANGFWRNKGGNLDFETFIQGRIEGTGRFKSMYSKKPATVSTRDYVAQTRAVVGSFPQLTQGQQARETETTLRSGASAAGQAQRIANTRPVHAASGPSIAQRYAQTISGLGRGAYS